MAIQDVVKRLIYQFSSTGADKVAADMGKVNTEQDKLAAGAPKVTKASLDLSKSFENLERRFDSTIRAQQDYQKVQDKVNAAVAQNPALQERANSVLAKAAEHFDKAGKATTAYAGAVDAARGAALGLAAGIGPLGAVLGSFGPWGIAAAAGIGLVTNAITSLRESAAKMGDEAVKLGQLPDVTGLTTAQVRGLTEAGQELGVGAESITGAIEKFTVNLDAARKGSGDLYENLRGIDKRLAEQTASTRSTSEALDLLAQAYNSITDATERAALARAAFGKGGLSVGSVLGVLAEAGGIDKYSKAAGEALGVTDEWTQSVRKLTNQVKDLKGDIETMKGGLFAKGVLEAELAALKAEHEIIKAARAAVKEGAPSDMYEAGLEQVAASFGTTRAAVAELTKAREKDTAAAQAATAATYDGTSALSYNTKAVNANADALARRAAQSARDVAALGSAATLAEREQARVDALRATPGLSPGVLQRAIQGVRDDTEKAYNSMDKYARAAESAHTTLVDLTGSSKDIGLNGVVIERSMSGVADETDRAKQEAERLAKEAERLAKAARDAQNAFNATVFSAQAVADATDIAAENTARAAKTAADFARAMQLGTFAPNVMPTGQHTFVGGAQVSYSGGGTGKILDVAGGKPAVLAAAETSYMAQFGLKDPAQYREEQLKASQDQIDAAMAQTDAIDELTDSTDRLTATNQELLSPYYTQDPRTSHIGFRSQGMASGGYVDVPGGISSNDNMIATVPVAGGERIYVDPMNSRRGGGGTVINISSPVTINGNANKDEFGRTLYQNNQLLAKQVRAATQ